MTREPKSNQGEEIDEPTLDSNPGELIADPLVNEEHMSLEEAAAYAGVPANEFEALARRAGIGRHYDPRVEGQFVWAKSDVEQAKKLHQAA